jgi:hypothetical protein
VATPAIKAEGKVARPRNILASLIKEKIREADEAAEVARRPYWEEIGELLYEAKGQFDANSEFIAWSQRHFGYSKTQTYRYLQAVTSEPISRAAPPDSSISLRQRLRDVGGHGGGPSGGRRAWTPAVDDIVERAKRDAERLRDEELNRQHERAAERQLALRLIDIGFKVLAKEMHPDKGGPRDAFQRLKRVVERLKAHA